VTQGRYTRETYVYFLKRMVEYMLLDGTNAIKYGNKNIYCITNW